MRRLIAVTLLGLSGLMVSGPGDAHAGDRIELESKMGFNYARFFGDVSDARDKAGFAGAMALHVPLQSWLTVQTELGYAMKGTSYGSIDDPVVNGQTRPGSFEQLWAIDYVELPVLLRARGNGDMFRPALIAGPVLGIKVIERFVLIGGQDEQYKAKSDVGRSLDLAVAGGAALEIGPADRCLSLEARFTRSLANVQDSQFPGWVGNRDLRFTIGWKSQWSSVFDRL
jgi:hypothetical protein